MQILGSLQKNCCAGAHSRLDEKPLHQTSNADWLAHMPEAGAPNIIKLPVMPFVEYRCSQLFGFCGHLVPVASDRSGRLIPDHVLEATKLNMLLDPCQDLINL